MRKTILIAAVLIVAPAFGQQQHSKEPATPPTVDQCRADDSAWLDQATSEDLAKLSGQEVMRRATEMSHCKKVDPKNANAYDAVASTYDIEMAARLADFIERHGLTEQFKAEDAAGKR